MYIRQKLTHTIQCHFNDKNLNRQLSGFYIWACEDGYECDGAGGYTREEVLGYIHHLLNEGYSPIYTLRSHLKDRNIFENYDLQYDHTDTDFPDTEKYMRAKNKAVENALDKIKTKYVARELSEIGTIDTGIRSELEKY